LLAGGANMRHPLLLTVVALLVTSSALAAETPKATAVPGATANARSATIATARDADGALRSRTVVDTTIRGQNQHTARSHAQFAKDGRMTSLTVENHRKGGPEFSRSQTTSWRPNGTRRESQIQSGLTIRKPYGTIQTPSTNVRKTYYPNSSNVRSLVRKQGSLIEQTHYRRDGQPVSRTVTSDGSKQSTVRFDPPTK